VTVARVDVDRRELDLRIVARDKRPDHKPINAKKDRQAKQEKSQGKGKSSGKKRRK